jgi:hypothetical protein
MSEYTMWDRDGRHVVINGQELKTVPHGVAEYEYALTIASDDVPAVVAALGGTTTDSVLELLRTHGEAIVRGGERKWLADRGVQAKTWSWFDPDFFAL